MNKIIEYFIKYPIWANAIIIVTAIAGILSLFSMPHSFFPEMQPNRVYVAVSYPGASPEEIEEGITTKIEESLNGIQGVKEITSRSSENSARITVEANEGEDINIILQDVKNAVDGIYSFPSGAEKPIVYAQKSRGGFGGFSNVVGFYSLMGPDDLWKLKKMSDKIERDLLNNKEISQIEVYGYPPIVIAIDVRENDLLRYNLTFDFIANIVKLSNVDMSGGSVKTNDEEIIIRSMNRTTDPNLIKNIVVYAQPNGDVIRLKDIADVNLEFSEVPIKSYTDGKRSINFIVKKTPSEDLNKIADEMTSYIEKFNLKESEYEMKNLFQFADLLDQRIYMLSKNLIIGLVLVCIVLGLFLSVRLSLWVAFGIPFSFIGMIAIGIFYGMTINMISLFGMILVVGILVDDGIVIAENIYSHFEMGKSPMRAALDGTKEVMNAVITSVLTTVFAFSTLLFVGGDLEMMQEMAFSVIACLLFSLIEAFLILPSHLSSKKILNKSLVSGQKKFRSKIEKIVNYLRDGYSKVITKIIKNYRWHVWTPALFILLVSILFSLGIIRWTFFPSIPFDNILVEFSFKPGERENRTEKFLWYCDSIIEQYNKELIKQYNDTLITYTAVSLGTTDALGEVGSHAGSIRLSVKENQLISTIEMSNVIKSRISKDSIKQLEKFSVGGQQQFGKEVSISLQSENSIELQKATTWIKEKISAFPEVKNSNDNGGIGNREIHLKLKQKAYLLGLNEMMILNQIRQGFFGEEVQRLILGRDEIKVWLRFPYENRNSMGSLDNMKIKTSSGLELPLYELADYDIKRGKVKINHINGKKEVRVDAALYNAELSSQVNEKIQKQLLNKLASLFPGVNYDIKGQAERAADSGQRLGIAFLISIVLIMITISLNFKSFYQARLILMVVPVGIFSALLGHGIVDKPFSTLSVWGVIALIGILVNDAVVMLDQFNRYLKSGHSINEAEILAGKSRYRAIILTTITTVAGLYPLILEKSFQAQFLIPMAISVAFGVLFGTIIILFYFPVLILYFNDMRRARWWLWNGGEIAPSKLEVEPVIKHINRISEFTRLESENVSNNKEVEILQNEIAQLKQLSIQQAEDLENLKNSTND
ncbi:MAG: acriflavin resistance protein [Crocinitomicaceae bacterium]|nr:acriflavin resistance protein [Crocinitomicaceae bacterium]